MARACTVCIHTSRAAIDRALVDGCSYRNIAAQFGVSASSVSRHRTEHLAQAIAESGALLAVPVAPTEAIQNRHADSAHAIDIIAEIARQIARVNRLSDAIDSWLTDPEHPEQYDIGPRSHEVTVVYLDPNDTTPTGAPKRKKATLQDLLQRVSETGRAWPQQAETRFADPRKLLIDAAGGLKEHLQLLTTILDKLHSAEQAERFEAAVLTAIGEAAPDVRNRIEESLRHSNALRQLAGRPLG